MSQTSTISISAFTYGYCVSVVNILSKEGKVYQKCISGPFANGSIPESELDDESALDQAVCQTVINVDFRGFTDEDWKKIFRVTSDDELKTEQSKYEKWAAEKSYSDIWQLHQLSFSQVIRTSSGARKHDFDFTEIFHVNASGTLIRLTHKVSF